MREGQPMTITNFLVDKPCTVMITGYLILIVISLLSLGLGFFTVADQSPREMLIWDNQATLDFDMHTGAINKIQAAEDSVEQAVRIQEARKWDPVILYSGSGGNDNLLTKSNLLQIKEIEEHFTSKPEWKDLCLAQSIDDSSCHSTKSFQSPLVYLQGINVALEFDPITFAKGVNKFDGDWTKLSQEQLDKIWQGFYSSSVYQSLKFLYQKDDAGALKSKVENMRSMAKFGAPLHIDGVRYKTINDEFKNQSLTVQQFQIEVENFVAEKTKEI